MKLFAASISVRAKDKIISEPVYARANSREEAIGLVLENAKNHWPFPDYTGHQVAVAEIPADFIAETQAMP